MKEACGVPVQDGLVEVHGEVEQLLCSEGKLGVKRFEVKVFEM